MIGVIGYVFTQFDFVHTDDFGLFGGSEVTSRDEVDDKHDGVGDPESPGETGYYPCDLLGELDPVSVPATSACVIDSKVQKAYIHPPSITAYPSLAATEAWAKRPVIKSPTTPAKA
jgi:hypothetical protein